jgi:hypothetical protein
MSTTPPSLTDRIVQSVVARTNRRVRNLVIEVAPTGERVVLRGRATSFYVKQLAQEGAQEALPGAHLVNAIVVE